MNLNPAYFFMPMWLAWIAYWLASAVGNKRPAGPVNSRWRILTVAFAVGIYLFGRLNPNPDYFRHRLLPPSVDRTWFCVALTALGLGFSVWARIALGTNWSGTPMIKEGHELIQSGPYRYVRHPIYTGLVIAVVAALLVNARVFDVYILAATALLIFYKIKVEERLMMSQFPAAYPEYRARTKAIFPGIL